jgi:hypothetical protein
MEIMGKEGPITIGIKLGDLCIPEVNQDVVAYLKDDSDYIDEYNQTMKTPSSIITPDKGLTH